MVRKGIILIVFFMLSMAAFAAIPSWMDNESRSNQYKDSDYFTGFSFSPLSTNDILEQSIEQTKLNARAELVSQIRVVVEHITSDSIRNVVESNKAYSSETFQATTTLRTGQAEIPGMQIESYVDEQQKYVAAFAYVPIKGLSTKLQRQLLLQLGRVQVLEEEAEQYLSDNNRSKTREQVLSIYYTLSAIDETRMTLIAVDENVNEEVLMTTDLRTARLRLVEIENQLNRGCKVFLTCQTDKLGESDRSLFTMVSGELSRMGCILVDSAQAEWTIRISASCVPLKTYQDGDMTFYYTSDVASLSIHNQQNEQVLFDQIKTKGAHTLNYADAAADGLRKLAIELSKHIIKKIQL